MLAKKTQQKTKKQVFANKQANNSKLCKQKTLTPINIDTEASDNSIASKILRASRASRASRVSKASRKIPTPPPVQMELIRSGKRKVKVTPNAVDSTSLKKMRVA